MPDIATFEVISPQLQALMPLATGAGATSKRLKVCKAEEISVLCTKGREGKDRSEKRKKHVRIFLPNETITLRCSTSPGEEEVREQREAWGFH